MEKPFVCLVSEISVDGKLTLGKGISSKIFMTLMDHEAEVFLHKLRANYDAIMVGSNTIKIDNSNLTVRYVKGKNPIRVIPCSDGKIPLESNVLNKDAPTIIAVSEKAKAEDIGKLKEKGVKVIKCGTEDKVNLNILLNELWKEGIRKMIIEGGPSLAYSMFKNKLIDEIKLVHIPVIVGGIDTPSLVWGDAAKTLNEVINTKLKKFYICGKNLITEYEVIY